MSDIFPHLHQHLVLSLFFMLAILIISSSDIVVLICISLMANDVENVFMCLFATCILLGENAFLVFANVLNGPFKFSLLHLRLISIF